MMANFDRDQRMQNGGTTVLASGPLLWDTDPNAERVMVDRLKIIQNGVEATNAGGDECAKQEAKWNLPLTTPQGQRLQSGRARGSGWVTVTKPGGGKSQYWESDVELH
jgi:hypothetical protein